MAPTWTDATFPLASWPLSSTLSGEVTSSGVFVPVSSHYLARVGPTADRRRRSRVKRFAPAVSRCQVRCDGRDNTGLLQKYERAA
jgi:hypothetical protein